MNRHRWPHSITSSKHAAPPLTDKEFGRVKDWRVGLGRSLCCLLSRPFVCECHTNMQRPWLIRAHARSEKPSQKHEVAQGDVGTSIERRDDADESAFLQFGITPSRPCHVSSPRHVERSVRISSHCALLFVSPQGLWTYPAGAPFDSGRRPDSLQEAIGNLLWQIQRTARTMVATGVE